MARFSPTGHQIFVGNVPYDMEMDELRQELRSWGRVVDVYYSPGTGWANVTMASQAEQQRVIAATKLHVLGHQRVDVKRFERKKEKTYPLNGYSEARPPSGPLRNPPHMPTGSNWSPSDGPRIPILASSTGAVPKKEKPIPLGDSALLISYVTPDIGVVKFSNQTLGVIHARTFFYCRAHQSTCREPGCPSYTTVAPTSTLSQLVPLHTYIGLKTRPVDIWNAPCKFQATMAWCSLSITPAHAVPASVALLDEQLMEYIKVLSTTGGEQAQLKSRISSERSSISPESTDPDSRNSTSPPSLTPSQEDLFQLGTIEINRRDFSNFLSKIQGLKEFFWGHFPTPLENDILSLSLKILKISSEKRKQLSPMLVTLFIKEHKIECSPEMVRNVKTRLLALIDTISDNSDQDIQLADIMSHPVRANELNDVLLQTSSLSFGPSTTVPSPSPPPLAPRSDSILIVSNVALSETSIPFEASHPSNLDCPPLKLDVRRKYQDVHDWIVCNFKDVNTTLYRPNFEGLGRLVVTILAKSDTSKEDITDDKKAFLKLSCATLAKFIQKINFEERFKQTVAWDLTIRAYGLFLWNKNPPPQISNETNLGTDVVLKAILAEGFEQDGFVFNMRGLIIHYFNDQIGLIQTPVGKVLFCRNLTYSKADGAWTPCLKESSAPIGSMVKCHALLLQNKKKSILFRAASKVWVIHSDAEEPILGLVVPGGLEYWNEMKKQYESIIQANPSFEYDPLSAFQKKEQDEEGGIYEQYFLIYMKANYKNLTVSRDVCQANREHAQQTFESLRSYLESVINDQAIQEEMSNALDVLALRGITLDDLRGHFVGMELLGLSRGFAEALEFILFHPGPTIFYGKDFKRNVGNIVPIVKTFFHKFDLIAREQIANLQERMTSSPNGFQGDCNGYFYEAVSQCLSKLVVSATPQVMELSNESLIPLSDFGRAPSPIQQSELLRKIQALQEEVGQLKAWKVKLEKSIQIMRLEKTSNPLGDLSAPRINESVTRKHYVSIKRDGEKDIYSFALNGTGHLAVETVMSIFPNASCLKFHHQITGHTRIVAKMGDVFDTPEDGWGERVYVANVPGFIQ